MERRALLEAFGDRISLPSLPEVVLRINTAIEDPSIGAAQIGRIAAEDPAITARVLRLANSPFYGLREPVTSAERAVTVIGARALRNVAMQCSIVKRYEHLRELSEFDLDGLWRHVVLTARLAHAIGLASARRCQLNPDDLYACGLLHDVGKVVILDARTDEYLECLRISSRTGAPLHDAERQIFGFSHIEVGALLAREWQLPEKVAHAIEFHHGPTRAIHEHSHVGVVAIADQLAYREGTETFDSTLARLGKVAERCLGIAPATFSSLAETVRGADVEALG
ncbi:MAG: HDOD domain-containing protein [Planctomycetes bacterium]|nr:HDOD domain-containing protein [Planctomycetota bacterium]